MRYPQIHHSEASYIVGLALCYLVYGYCSIIEGSTMKMNDRIMMIASVPTIFRIVSTVLMVCFFPKNRLKKKVSCVLRSMIRL